MVAAVGHEECPVSVKSDAEGPVQTLPRGPVRSVRPRSHRLLLPGARELAQHLPAGPAAHVVLKGVCKMHRSVPAKGDARGAGPSGEEDAAGQAWAPKLQAPSCTDQHRASGVGRHTDGVNAAGYPTDRRVAAASVACHDAALLRATLPAQHPVIAVVGDQQRPGERIHRDAKGLAELVEPVSPSLAARNHLSRWQAAGPLQHLGHVGNEHRR
mmetsp:Transcript_109534/g.338089  ORF Transcript_109534/g.338089 Transcript_109534/m.338089 type:complete len:213 (+) Transcript_109534:550-1188(+)